jgi:hypothetical protein
VFDRSKQQIDREILPAWWTRRAGGPLTVSDHFQGGCMNSRQRYQYQSLRSSQLFLDAHVAEVGVLNGTEPRKQLDKSLEELDSKVTEQGTRTRDKLGERFNQRALERVLRKKHLDPIAKFARAELVDVPNFKALTPETAKFDGVRLVQVARAVAGAAEPLTAQFVGGHFPEDFVDQLLAAANAVKKSIDTRTEQHLKKVNATKAIREAIASGRSAVARLDARVTRLIAGNAPLLEEWRVAKRVVAKPGPVRTTANGTPVTAPAAVPAHEPSPTTQEG